MPSTRVEELEKAWAKHDNREGRMQRLKHSRTIVVQSVEPLSFHKPRPPALARSIHSAQELLPAAVPESNHDKDKLPLRSAAGEAVLYWKDPSYRKRRDKVLNADLYPGRACDIQKRSCVVRHLPAFDEPPIPLAERLSLALKAAKDAADLADKDIATQAAKQAAAVAQEAAPAPENKNKKGGSRRATKKNNKKKGGAKKKKKKKKK